MQFYLYLFEPRPRLVLDVYINSTRTSYLHRTYASVYYPARHRSCLHRVTEHLISRKSCLSLFESRPLLAVDVWINSTCSSYLYRTRTETNDPIPHCSCMHCAHHIRSTIKSYIALFKPRPPLPLTMCIDSTRSTLYTLHIHYDELPNITSFLYTPHRNTFNSPQNDTINLFEV